LTTTMGNMRGVIQAVREADDMPHMRVMVGGAAVTKEFAEDIGADGWAPDAASAVLLARGLVAEARGVKIEIKGVAATAGGLRVGSAS
ncbi:MAG: B12-binding domain-containing protein, partial [Chloroflexota bacterium]